jgi:hypothetical protein
MENSTALAGRRDKGWELPAVACEDHAPPLEGLSPEGEHQTPPKTIEHRGGGRWRRRKRGHTSERETNSLACASHTQVRGRRLVLRRPLVEAEDTGKPNGEARVGQYLTEDRRSRTKDFDLKT